MVNKKYLPNGQAVHVSEELSFSQGWLAYPVYMSEFGDTIIDIDSPFIAKAIYDEPPIGIFDSAIESLKEEIRELKDQKAKLIKSLNEDRVYLRDTKNSLERKFSKYDQLKHLLDFIDGKITHYVIVDCGARIVSITDETKGLYDRDPLKYGQKLLTLYGKYPDNLNWKLSEYNDGSGRDKKVFPCMSYGDAVRKVKAYIDEKIKEWSLNKTTFLMRDILETVREYDPLISVPGEYVSFYREHLQAEADKRKKETATIEGQLEKRIKDLDKIGIKTEVSK